MWYSLTIAPYSAIQKNETINTCTSEYFVNWKNPDTKEYILYNSTYMRFKIRQTWVIKISRVAAFESRDGGVRQEGSLRELAGRMECSIAWLEVMVTKVYTFIKTSVIAHVT